MRPLQSDAFCPPRGGDNVVAAGKCLFRESLAEAAGAASDQCEPVTLGHSGIPHGGSVDGCTQQWLVELRIFVPLHLGDDATYQAILAMVPAGVEDTGRVYG